jgi:hypothetical protein
VIGAAVAVVLLGAGGSSEASSTSCKVAFVSRNMPPSGPFFGAGRLVGVAAGSASNVWAVGYVTNGGKQQLEGWHWNGRNWDATGSKVVGNLTPLFAVGARGNDAWAVGGRANDRTIVLRWRRGAWTVVPVPAAFRKTGLLSVAVVSARDVWAAGIGVLLHWNGRAWSRHPGPEFHLGASGAYLAVARIPGTTQVWVTGIDGLAGSLSAARWTGSTWDVVQVPDGLGGSGSLGAVTLTNAWLATVASTGSQRQRSGLLRWDGSAWTPVTVPNPAPFDSIASVAARTATDAWAVGEFSPHAGSPYLDAQSWVLHWDGKAWTRLPAPGGAAGLNAVTVVPGTRDAWAVGGSIAVRYHC